jgi:hypothetical protein
MPRIKVINTCFKPDFYAKIREQVQSTTCKYGYSFRALFSVQNGNFQFPTDIAEFFEYVEKQLYSRIFSLTKTASPPQRDPITSIWFLPENQINQISENLVCFLREKKLFENFQFFIVNTEHLSQNKLNKQTIKQEIAKIEQEIKNNQNN